MVEHIHQSTFPSEAGLLAAITQFETEQLAEGYLSISLMELEFFETIQSFDSAGEMMFSTPLNVRAIDVAISEDEGTAFLKTTFYLPGQQLEDMRERGRQAPHEDF
ncbi:hypothetical protein [Vreelandella populi]|uniref:hypothetical protein n=1 Tax=Vreelandella populi TaxID=2498858 RepID=UPI000F8EC473|nr:hypothetical protein [Halomonas populi]RUR52011.1 hypothetical protein ELY40_14965 [Halomonas populi]